VLLDGLLEGDELIFDAANGSFLFAGVEGKGALVCLELGDRLLHRLEIDLRALTAAVADEVGGCARDISFEQGKQVADEGKHGSGESDGALELAGFGRHGPGEGACCGIEHGCLFRGLYGDIRGGFGHWDLL